MFYIMVWVIGNTARGNAQQWFVWPMLLCVIYLRRVFSWSS